MGDNATRLPHGAGYYTGSINLFGLSIKFSHRLLLVVCKLLQTENVLFLFSVSYSGPKSGNFTGRSPRREEFKVYIRNVPLDMTKVRFLPRQLLQDSKYMYMFVLLIKHEVNV